MGLTTVNTGITEIKMSCSTNNCEFFIIKAYGTGYHLVFTDTDHEGDPELGDVRFDKDELLEFAQTLMNFAAAQSSD